MSGSAAQLKSVKTPVRTSAAPIPGKAPDVFTIDVEDWFHILEVTDSPDLSDWASLPSHVERNLSELLDLLALVNVKATCFTLGWMAERIPRQLRDAAEAGHEIASHGFAHQVVASHSRSQFREDIRTAKIALEDAIGKPVRGYRAPGFSITRETSWAFDEIVEAGYRFDSSIFPARHGHGGIPDATRSPHFIQTSAGDLLEFPVSVVDTPLGPQCFFGGGYLRLYPLWLIRTMARRVRRNGYGVVWYIHPREIDPEHPRIAMPLKRRLKSYINLRSTAPKLKAILGSANFITLGELASEISESVPNHA